MRRLKVQRVKQWQPKDMNHYSGDGQSIKFIETLVHLPRGIRTRKWQRSTEPWAVKWSRHPGSPHPQRLQSTRGPKGQMSICSPRKAMTSAQLSPQRCGISKAAKAPKLKPEQTVYSHLMNWVLLSPSKSTKNSINEKWQGLVMKSPSCRINFRQAVQTRQMIPTTKHNFYTKLGQYLKHLGPTSTASRLKRYIMVASMIITMVQKVR